MNDNFINASEIKNKLAVGEIVKILDEELNDINAMESMLVANKNAYETECRVIMNKIVDYVRERDGKLKS